jgi:hypothetical protein
MFQLDPSVFGNIKSKADYDRQKAMLMAQAKQRGQQSKLGELQIAQAEKVLNAPKEYDTQQILAEAIKAGGVENLPPELQAQLQAADIAQRAKVSVDTLGNRVTNQSYFDLMGANPSQVINQPPSVMRGQGIVPEVGASQIPLPRMGQPSEFGFADVAGDGAYNMANEDYLPPLQDNMMVDPTQMGLPAPTKPDLSSLSPVTRERAMADYLADVRKVEMENAKLNAERQKETLQKQKAMPKAELAFNSMRDDTQNMVDTIDKAIDNTSGWTAGLGTFLTSIPASGAKNLEATLSTIQADSAFSTLQAMRDASPTGGALGAISERELSLLQNARVALDQSQSPSELKDNLENYKRIRTQALKNTAEGFKLDYGYYPKGLDKFIKGQAPQEDKSAVSWQEYFK